MDWDGEFMKPHTLFEDFVEYEWNGGTYFVPADIEGILPSNIEIIERYSDKWFSRLSAPGYLDCTDWSGPFDTEEEAFNYLEEMYA